MKHFEYSLKEFGQTAIQAALALSLLLGVFSASVAHATNTVPKILNYQARITDSGGVPVPNGSLSVVFKLYDGDGNCLYSAQGSCGTPTAKSVTVTNGVFTTAIGSAADGDNEIPDGLFDNNVVTLGITVGADAEMTPRKRLTAAPYALNADRLDDLDVTSSGSTTPYIPSTTTNGNLVITGDPQGAAVGSGSFYVNPANAAANETLLGIASNGSSRFQIDKEGDIDHTGSLLAISASSTAQFVFRGAASQSTDIFEVQDSATNRLLSVSATGVAVMTSSPSAVFDVRQASGNTARLFWAGPAYSAFSADVQTSYLDITNSVIGFHNNLEAGSGVYNGLAVVAENNIATDTTGFQAFESHAVTSHASGNKSVITNGFFQSYHTGAGTITSLTDVAIYPQSKAGSGTITEAIGLYVSPNLDGTTTNLYRLRLAEGSSFGVTTNSYGLYIDEMTGNGDVLNYSIYSANPSSPFVLEASGNVGIGNAFPANRLTVGTATSTFEVNSAGNLVKVNNVVYSWPASQGGVSTLLQNNGSGTLSWVASSGLVNLNQAYLSSTSTGAFAEISITPSLGALTIADTFSGTGNIFEIQNRTNAAGNYSRRYFTVSSTTTGITTGTASMPGLSFIGDGNTGIYQNIDGAVAFTSNGSTVLIVEPTGNVTQFGGGGFYNNGGIIDFGASVGALAATPTTLTLGAAATSLTIGATTGRTTVQNSTFAVSSFFTTSTTSTLLNPGGSSSYFAGINTGAPSAALTVSAGTASPLSNLFEVQNKSGASSWTQRYFSVSSTSTQILGGSRLVVGATNTMVVNSSGNFEVVNGVNIRFPSSQGSSGQLLTNDGAGNLTWTTVSAGSSNLNQAYLSSTSTGAYPEISITPSLGALTIADTLSGTGNVFEIQNRTTSAGDYSQRYFTVSATSVSLFSSAPEGTLHVNHPDAFAGYPFVVQTSGSDIFFLDFQGNANIARSLTVARSAELATDADQFWPFPALNVHPAADFVSDLLQLNVGATNRLNVTSAGYLGLNDATPDSLLTVRGPASPTQILFEVSNASNSSRYMAVSSTGTTVTNLTVTGTCTGCGLTNLNQAYLSSTSTGAFAEISITPSLGALTIADTFSGTGNIFEIQDRTNAAGNYSRRYFTVSSTTTGITTGTASMPGLSFIGDSNTGIYQNIDGAVAFTSNGSTVLIVEPTGDVTQFGGGGFYNNGGIIDFGASVGALAATPTTLTLGAAATSLTIGATTGTTTVRNTLAVGTNIISGTSASIDFTGFDVSSTGTLQINLPLSTGNWAVCHRESSGAGTNQTLVDCANTPAADYMEMYPAAAGLEMGDIVMPGTEHVPAANSGSVPQVVKTTSSYEGGMIGVVSNPNDATDFNSIGHEIEAQYHPMPVALKGRVKVKVTAENGPIQVGDPVTSSSTAGVGMRATKPGMIVGQALEAWNGPGQGTILVFMGNGFHSGMAITTDGMTSLFADNFAFKPLAVASASGTSFSSYALSFGASAWNSASNTALTRNISVRNDITDAETYRLSFKNDGGDTLASLNQSGDFALAGSLTVNGGFDYAETFPAAPDLDAGDIVMVDAENENGYGVKKSDAAYENTLLGVISTKPGFLTGKSSPGTQPVALAGRVPVKVNTESGNIRPGDPITSSSVPGVGMKATEAGRVIGIALQGWSGDGTSLITVFVNPSWWNGPAALAESTVGNALTVGSEVLVDFKNSTLSNISAIISTNGLWSVTSDGYLTAERIDAKELITNKLTLRADNVGDRSVGKARLQAGYDAVLVENSNVTEESIIVITFEGNPGSNWWIEEKHQGSFMLKLAQGAISETPFTYWILPIDGILDLSMALDEESVPEEPVGSGTGTPLLISSAPTESGSGTADVPASADSGTTTLETP